jgi:mono/diheme cytochrome c family protein
VRKLVIFLAVACASTVAASAQQPAGGGRAGGAGRGAQPPPAAPPRGGGLTMGPNDRPAVDPAAADRGRSVWAAECITCHGTQARGTEQGPNLIRSVLVLHDRAGSELVPFLRKGHTLQSGRPASSLADAQITDLAHFLRQRVNDTLRGSPIFHEQNILSGDAKAGETYFNGDGRCTSCHTATMHSLAGIAARVPGPIDLQQRMLFPGTGRIGGTGRGAPSNAVTVAVTPSSGPTVSGVLVQLDDFYVTLRDNAGNTQVLKIGPGVKVIRTDPLQAHHDLLDRISDKQIHDLVAYLTTLK